MTATKKTRTPPRHSYRLHELDAVTVLEIRTERKRSATADYYTLTPLHSDFGQAFRLEKIGPVPGTYNVCLEPGADHCDCRGHEAHGKCKHSLCLRQLSAASEV